MTTTTTTAKDGMLEAIADRYDVEAPDSATRLFWLIPMGRDGWKEDRDACVDWLVGAFANDGPSWRSTAERVASFLHIFEEGGSVELAPARGLRLSWAPADTRDLVGFNLIRVALERR